MAQCYHWQNIYQENISEICRQAQIWNKNLRFTFAEW